MDSPINGCEQLNYSPDVGARIFAADRWLNPFPTRKSIKQPFEIGSNPIIRNGLVN